MDRQEWILIARHGVERQRNDWQHWSREVRNDKFRQDKAVKAMIG